MAVKEIVAGGFYYVKLPGSNILYTVLVASRTVLTAVLISHNYDKILKQFVASPFEPYGRYKIDDVEFVEEAEPPAV